MEIVKWVIVKIGNEVMLKIFNFGIEEVCKICKLFLGICKIVKMGVKGKIVKMSDSFND